QRFLDAVGADGAADERVHFGRQLGAVLGAEADVVGVGPAAPWTHAHVRRLNGGRGSCQTFSPRRALGRQAAGRPLRLDGRAKARYLHPARGTVAKLVRQGTANPSYAGSTPAGASTLPGEKSAHFSSGGGRARTARFARIGPLFGRCFSVRGTPRDQRRERAGVAKP